MLFPALPGHGLEWLHFHGRIFKWLTAISLLNAWLENLNFNKWAAIEAAVICICVWFISMWFSNFYLWYNPRSVHCNLIYCVVLDVARWNKARLSQYEKVHCYICTVNIQSWKSLTSEFDTLTPPSVWLTLTAPPEKMSSCYVFLTGIVVQLSCPDLHLFFL